MLTIFSIPKPFIGHIEIIQRNAIHSWSLLHPDCEIILCGDESGTGEIAAEFKAKWIANIARNEYGTPLINSVFDQAQQIAHYRLMCYVNADIILLSDFIEAIQRIRFPRFVMIGQRWNIDITRLWDFDRPDWEERLRKYVINHGELHPPWGSDYFVFLWDSAIGKLPGFAAGRAGWDNWFIFRARRLGIPVVDVTKGVTVVHQNHDYTHVPNRRGGRTEGPEADWNLKLAGGSEHLFSPLDATHVMTSRAVLPALGYWYLRRRLQTLPILVPATRPLVQVINLVRKVIKYLGKVISYQKNC